MISRVVCGRVELEVKISKNLELGSINTLKENNHEANVICYCRYDDWKRQNWKGFSEEGGSYVKWNLV